MVTIPCHKSYESDSYGSDTQDTSKATRWPSAYWMQSNFCRATSHATSGYRIVALPLCRVPIVSD